MKVIFLDHDGVICLSTEWGGRHKKQKEWGGRKLSMTNSEVPLDCRFDNFNKKAIKILNEILEETGAEIVVSSDWKRWANVEEMGEYYESQGIKKKPIAFTPNLGQCTWYIDAYPAGFMWSRAWDLEQTRVIEIKQYLHDHPEITHWVSIDDLRMGKEGLDYSIPYEHEWGLDNFVETPKSTEGIKQTGIKEKIIKFLNSEIQDKKIN
jgi:hypothetical protein